MRGKAHYISTWGPHLFLFYREKIFRKLFPIMILITLYAIVIAYIDQVSPRFEKITNYNLGQFHLIFSFILTIIISFRVNTAYARWWEGRVLWGSIVNNCRNLGLKFDTFVGLNNYPQFKALLAKLPSIITLNLRKDKPLWQEELNRLGLPKSDENPVIQLTQQLYRILNQLRDEEKIRWEQYMAMDTHLANLMDMNGGCERIANTPVPSAFAFFVRQALLFYSLIFPFGWVDTFGFLIIPMMIMIVYILLGLEILSEELEEPFGRDDNDLPLDAISSTIASNINGIAAKKLP